MFASWLAVIVFASIVARATFAGRSPWSRGRAMFVAAVVYVGGLPLLGVLYFGISSTDAWEILAAATMASLPLSLLWPFVRFLSLPWLFWAGFVNACNAVGEWRYTDWEVRVIYIASWYGAVYVGGLLALSPDIRHFLRSPLRPPADPGHCAGCGYDLRGLPAPRCPECGRAFDPHDKQAALTRD